MNIQKLIRLLCVCTKCHHVIHFGLSQIEGRSEDALKHLMCINNWDRMRAEEHVENRFEVWRIKNEISWEVDFSMLSNMSLPSLRLPSRTRKTYGETALPT